MSISVKNVSYIYDNDTELKWKALDDINLTITKFKMTAIIGKTGCGKTTLMQHLNALLKPTSGEIIIDDFVLTKTSKHQTLKPLRKKVGLVFQFSESQLFEETVFKDIAFGPKNYGASDEEAATKVYQAMQLVGLDESYMHRSCFQLSGGEKRRVAIAGILALDPEILILDEPTAGLDPQGSFEMMQLLLNLKNHHNKTIIVVTHDNDLVYTYFDEVILMDQGKVVMKNNVIDFFSENQSVVLPQVIHFKQLLLRKGIHISKYARTIKEVLEEIKNDRIR